MPKMSKIRSPSSTPKKEPKTEKMYACVRCGREYKTQPNHFTPAQSAIYSANNGFLPVCRQCVNELFEHYRSVLQDEAEAIRRVCMKFDIYWSREIYDSIPKENTSNSRISAYIRRCNLIHMGAGKTYDTTLDEEYARSTLLNAPVASGEGEEGIEDVDPKIIEFWGAGFDKSFYLELDRKYKYWTERLEEGGIDIGAEALYKQVCLLEVTINRDSAMGKPTEKSVNTLNNLLGSLNIKPSQKKDDLESAFDNLSFGQKIRMWENTKPIPEPDPELKDVDGIIKYISTWFLGHLCHMLNIKNSYCKMYEEALERERVERPELAEEDDETLFNDIFGGDT